MVSDLKSVSDERPVREAEPKQSGSTGVSHARDFGRPGFYVKLVLMLLVNAFGVFGILASWAQQDWGVLVFLAVTLVIANYVYFSRRTIPAKYLFPGLVFLLVYQVYVMGSTAFVAFTNYGDGHNSTKDAAITQIMKTSDRRVEGTETYPVTVLDSDGAVSFAIVDDGVASVGDQDNPLTEVADATVEEDRVVEVPGYEVLGIAQIQHPEIADLLLT